MAASSGLHVLSSPSLFSPTSTRNPCENWPASIYCQITGFSLLLTKELGEQGYITLFGIRKDLFVPEDLWLGGR